MLIDNYYQIDPTTKKNIIVSLRYWMMFDLDRNKDKLAGRETDIMLEKLSENWSKGFVDRFFEEAWNGLSGTFLRQNGIEPLIMQH